MSRCSAGTSPRSPTPMSRCLASKCSPGTQGSPCTLQKRREKHKRRSNCTKNRSKGGIKYELGVELVVFRQKAVTRDRVFGGAGVGLGEHGHSCLGQMPKSIQLPKSIHNHPKLTSQPTTQPSENTKPQNTTRVRNTTAGQTQQQRHDHARHTTPPGFVGTAVPHAPS